MEDQANRPHRKTKEKKKHTGGVYSRMVIYELLLTLDRHKSQSIRLCSTGTSPKASC